MHSWSYSRQGQLFILILFALFFSHCSVHLSIHCTIHCTVSDLTYAFNEISVLRNSYRICLKDRNHSYPLVFYHYHSTYIRFHYLYETRYFSLIILSNKSTFSAYSLDPSNCFGDNLCSKQTWRVIETKKAVSYQSNHNSYY